LKDLRVRSPLRAVALCAWGLLMLSCGPETRSTPVVARVGDSVLTVAHMMNRVAPGLSQDETAAQRKEFVDKWVEQQLVYQEALEQGLDENARIQQLLDEARRDVLVASFLNREFETQAEVPEQEITDYFVTHAQQFMREEDEIRIQHILLGGQRHAVKLRQKLLQGDSFEDAALSHSLDIQSKGSGGDLGYFGSQDYPELWQACLDLTVNRLSKPVESSRGLHLLRVLDRQVAGTVKDLEQVRDEIVETLVHDHYRQRLDDLVQQLKSKKSWEIDESQLHGNS
jgi:peptidyl-prolyl cis-trans isomerase C